MLKYINTITNIYLFSQNTIIIFQLWLYALMIVILSFNSVNYLAKERSVNNKVKPTAPLHDTLIYTFNNYIYTVFFDICLSNICYIRVQ